MTISTGNSYLDSLAPKTTSTTTSSSTGTGTLDQTAFLKLMTTQMQTQDPFNPVDNTQMVAQMAQFSATTGIAQMNQTLSGMATSLASSRVGDAASWIGKSALVAGSSATALSDGSFAGQVTLPSDASEVNISLVDATGNVVYNGTATNVSKGDTPFYFDGKDSAGNAIPGPLKISVNAKDSEAQQINATSAAWTTITGVQSPASGTTKLVTGAGTIDPSAALQLS